MNKTAFNIKALKLSTEICGDYSIGQKVFAYLEKTLTNEEEIAAVVNHAGECKFCMNTMVRWHYDCIIAERRSREAETIESTAFARAGYSIRTTQENFSAQKDLDEFIDNDGEFEKRSAGNEFFRDLDNEICH